MNDDWGAAGLDASWEQAGLSQGPLQQKLLADAVNRVRTLADSEGGDAKQQMGRLGLKVHHGLRYGAERYPGIGGVLTAGQDVMVLRSANRIKDGEADPQDYAAVASYLNYLERSGDRSFTGKVVDTLTQIPGFVIDVAMTGGTYSLGKSAAKKVLGETAKTAIGKAAQAAIPRAVGVAAQTAAVPQMVAKNVTSRMMPEFTQQVDETGKPLAIDVGDDKSFIEAIGPALADTAIELGTEKAGGKLASGAGKVFDLIPGSAKVKALKTAISEKWLAKPGRTMQTLDEVLKAGGWNGVVGEVMEERAGDVARLAIGLESPDENVTGQLATGQFGKAAEQLAVEAAAFSVPGASQIAIRRLSQLKAIRAKGFVSSEDAKAAGIEGETRKERLASADAEIQQLTQEIQDASTVRGPEEQVRQEQGGEDLRGQGQVEVPAEPAGEVASAPEVQVGETDNLYDQAVAAVRKNGRASIGVLQQNLGIPFERARGLLDEMERGGVVGAYTGGQFREVLPEQQPQSEVAQPPDILTSRELLDWLKQAEESAPQEAAGEAVPSPAVEQPTEAPEQPAEVAPKAQPPRDVAAEIRSALAEGPVTVVTPKVPSGFKIAKVREDGKVVTKRGRLLEPDETWQVKPKETPRIENETAKAALGVEQDALEPEVKAVEPVSYHSGLSRSPAETDAAIQSGTPVGVAAFGGLSTPMRKKLVDYANSGGKVFIDSGAFTAFKKGSEIDWDKVLFTYHEMLTSVKKGQRNNVAIVAPDVVGKHEDTLRIQRELRDKFQPFIASGATVIFPVQQGGHGTLAANFADLTDTFEDMDGVTLGVPFNAKAWSQESVLDLMRFRDKHDPGRKFHLLGAGSEKVAKLMEAAKAEGLSVEGIASDAMPKTISQRKKGKRAEAEATPAPPPELAAAGITIKRTPKGGWSVTGIPKEIADGLSIDYQGKRSGKGYLFRKDPTAGLLDAAREIARQAEFDAAERAQGRRRTRIGYLDEETAGAFEQELADRVSLAKEEVRRRNDSVDELLSQFIENRGVFKKNLLRAAERGDSDTLKKFDLMVQYAKDHPELSLPTDESKLFTLLVSESFTKSDADLEDEIAAELAAEFAEEVGDESFDFGANDGEAPAVKQTAIPGTEEAVASQERREEIKQANKQFTTPKGKQKAFISGLGKDLPGQKTAFDVDGLDGGDDAGDAQKKPDPSPPGKPTLQDQADAATKEAFDELDAFGKLLKGKGLASNPMLDPEVIAGAGRLVYKFAKAGFRQFAAFIEALAAKHGRVQVDALESVFASEWDRVQKSGEFPGMEPRTPEATAAPQPPSGDDLTSIKKAIVNEMRELVGLPEMEGSTPQTVEWWAETARGALAADPMAAIRLVNELATNPRPISQHDAMLLQFRYRELANKLKPVVDAFFAAVESKDPVAIASARKTLINARTEMTEFEGIIHPSKETWGRAGVALQQMMKADFSVEAVLRRGQEANNGEELTSDQTAELTKMAKQLEALQNQFDEQRRRNEASEAELASKRQHEETVKQVKQEKVHRKSDKRKNAEKKVADAWEKFRKAAGTTAGSSGANLFGPAVELAAAYVELGYVRFAEFMAAVRKNMPDADEKLFREAWDEVSDIPAMDLTDRAALTKEARMIQRAIVEAGMTDRDQVIDAVHKELQHYLPDLTRRQTMDALSRYGQFQTQSQDEIEKLLRGMNTEILKLSQIDQLEKAMRRVNELRIDGKTDEEIGKVLADEKLLVEATGLVRDRPSQTIRQLTQKYNELKKAIPATTDRKAGLLQTAVAQIERSLTNRIQDLRWEIDHGERIVRESRERPSSDRIKELEAERDALLKIHREIFPPRKKTMTEAQRIASAIRAADRAIEQIEKQLETRDFDRERRGPVESPELDAKRARLQQLRAAREAAKALELDRMEGEGGTPGQPSESELARRMYEASLRRRIADYKTVLAEGDFSPKPKKGPRELSSSELKLKREMEDIRHQVLQKYADYHLDHLHGIAWGLDKIAEAAHLSRALMTSFDLSAVMRQGGLAAMGHPVLAKRAMFETAASLARTYDSDNAKALQGGVTLENVQSFLKTIDSRQAEFNLMHKLTQGKDGEFRLRAGLNLPSTDQAITKQEEAFQGRWGKKVPGIAVSSRLYTMILNKMRADLFDSMVQNLGRGGKVTMDEAKIIASFVNVATGRSDLKMLNNTAATLNTVFFAPRYVVSRFQYLAMPFYLPFQSGSWRVKRAIYKEYARTAAGIGTVLGTFALAAQLLYDDDDEDRPQIETDARSSDFLKVRIGETRLDFLAGLSQAIVLSQRLLPEFMGGGSVKSSVTGKIRKFGEGYKPETRWTVIGRFGRSKFAPVPGAIATIADDWTNIVGQEETPLSMALSLASPLSLRDVVTTMQTQGIAKGTAMSVLSILGVGMNTYGPRTQYTTGTEEERKAQFTKDLKTASWDSPDPAYSEFLSDQQMKQFAERRHEKRGLVVYNATYAGKNEEELATRDKNREHLTEMGVSFEDARELLKDYYRRPDENGRAGRITDSYFPKLRELRRMYGQ